MQCAACLAVFDTSFEDCPTCQAPLNGSVQTAPHEESFMNTSTCQETPTSAHATEPPPAPPAGATSTLIEFPGAGRNRPQWRKDLSERVREIQQRRAQEAARETEEAVSAVAGDAAQAEAARDSATPQLGLVPPPEPQEMNPIVAKALERIERARQQQSPASRQPARGGAATAAAVVRSPEESYHVAAQARPALDETQTHAPAAMQAATQEEVVADESNAKSAENARATTLVIVPPASNAPPATNAPSETDALINEVLSKPRPRRHLSEIADEALLTRIEATTLPHATVKVEETTRHAAAPARRFAGGLIDLVVVAFASSPFAAIMELTNGNWTDPRVAGSLAGVVLVIMFVYLTASVALTGRTWGMALVSLRAVDERNGLIPTAGQCARRAILYMLSLATLGIGLLPALFGSERRAAHDRLSSTLVVRAD
jgi:uncharacterized RDD family membrane protein YckC